MRVNLVIENLEDEWKTVICCRCCCFFFRCNNRVVTSIVISQMEIQKTNRNPPINIKSMHCAYGYQCLAAADPALPYHSQNRNLFVKYFCFNFVASLRGLMIGKYNNR